MEVAKSKNRGRQKIEMKKVEDERKRLVTFSKRREGLFKKAGELSELCGARTAVVVFTKNGKTYSCGDVDSVFDQFLAGMVPESDDHHTVSSVEGEEKKAAAEETRSWWEKTVEELLMEREVALQELKKNVDKEEEKKPVELLMEREVALIELKKNVDARLEVLRRQKAVDKAASPALSSSSLSSISCDPDQDVVVNVKDPVHHHRYDEFVDDQYHGEDDDSFDFGGSGLHGGGGG